MGEDASLVDLMTDISHLRLSFALTPPPPPPGAVPGSRAAPTPPPPGAVPGSRVAPTPPLLLLPTLFLQVQYRVPELHRLLFFLLSLFLIVRFIHAAQEISRDQSHLCVLVHMGARMFSNF